MSCVPVELMMIMAWCSTETFDGRVEGKEGRVVRCSRSFYGKIYAYILILSYIKLNRIGMQADVSCEPSPGIYKELRPV